MKDELTGLLNPEAFRLLVEHELVVGRRLQRVDTLLVIDIENLGAVNECAGRDGGDETLRAVGKLLQKTARESDVIGRIGGDEFAVFALDCSGDSLAKRISTEVSDAVDNTVTTPERPSFVTIRIGITEVKPGEQFDDLIARAGPAMLADAEARLRRDSSAP